MTLNNRRFQHCRLITRLFALCVILHVFCQMLIFFKIHFFEKLFQEYHRSVKQVALRSGPTYCRGLACVQNVCKIYQQITLGTSTNTQTKIMHTIVIHMITLFCVKMKTNIITATTIHNITHKRDGGVL